MNSLFADVSCWKVVEIDLTSPCVYDNPYQDVTITAAFVGPQGQRIVREAFWYGQNMWKVRFAPTAVGRWTWKTACSDTANVALLGVLCIGHGQQSSVLGILLWRVVGGNLATTRSDGYLRGPVV